MIYVLTWSYGKLLPCRVRLDPDQCANVQCLRSGTRESSFDRTNFSKSAHSSSTRGTTDSYDGHQSAQAVLR
jgi:hypothetical protein